MTFFGNISCELFVIVYFWRSQKNCVRERNCCPRRFRVVILTFSFDINLRLSKQRDNLIEQYFHLGLASPFFCYHMESGLLGIRKLR